MVSPGKNLWHCLGACGAGGSTIDWVMRSKGVSFRHAVELLRAGQGASPLDGPAPVRSTLRRLPIPVEPDAGDSEALAQVVEFYHSTLLGSPDALAYLRARRIDNPDAMEVFKPWTCQPHPRLPTAQPPDQARRRGEGTAAAPRCTARVRPRAPERLRGRAGLRALRGRRRDVRPQARLGPTHRPARPPLPARSAQRCLGRGGPLGGEVVICESLIDALSFWCAGFHNVTASYGTAGFTDDHRAAFARHGVHQGASLPTTTTKPATQPPKSWPQS